MKKINVIQNKEIAPGIYSLIFRNFFDFIPGQVVKITTATSVEPRMYSIASGVSDKNIQLIYDIKPEGLLTNQLRHLKADDELLVSLPFGQFTGTNDNAWWIAAGTGIAPFYSMMRSGRINNVRLIHGVRKPELLLFKDEFKEKLNNNYIPCCSGNKHEGMFFGRVTEFLKQVDQFPHNSKYFLCGSAEMVVDVRDILIDKKIAFGDIYSEIYF